MDDDIPVQRSDRSSDTDFPGSFRYRNEHDIHDPNASYDEGNRGDSSQERLERSGDILDSGERVGRIVYGEIRLVRIGYFKFREEVIRYGLFR